LQLINSTTISSYST